MQYLGSPFFIIPDFLILLLMKFISYEFFHLKPSRNGNIAFFGFEDFDFKFK